MTEREARSRLEAHRRLGLDEGPADHLIANEGSPEELSQQVEQLWGELVYYSA